MCLHLDREGDPPMGRRDTQMIKKEEMLDNTCLEIPRVNIFKAEYSLFIYISCFLVAQMPRWVHSDFHGFNDDNIDETNF